MMDGALRQRGESILGRQGVDKLTRTTVYGGGTRVEGHVGARSDGWLPALTLVSESFMALRRSLGSWWPGGALARGGWHR
jgi:hypothetical protein